MLITIFRNSDFYSSSCFGEACNSSTKRSKFEISTESTKTRAALITDRPTLSTSLATTTTSTTSTTTTTTTPTSFFDTKPATEVNNFYETPVAQYEFNPSNDEDDILVYDLTDLDYIITDKSNNNFPSSPVKYSNLFGGAPTTNNILNGQFLVDKVKEIMPRIDHAPNYGEVDTQVSDRSDVLTIPPSNQTPQSTNPTTRFTGKHRKC